MACLQSSAKERNTGRTEIHEKKKKENNKKDLSLFQVIDKRTNSHHAEMLLGTLWVLMGQLDYKLGSGIPKTSVGLYFV